MATLIYSAITSLDGYVADEDGNFDRAVPDEEVHSAVNDLERRVGTYLYGRRMYEVMVAWETMSLADQPRYLQDYAEIWRAADKMVYSRTLDTVSSARTRIEREFDPEAVRRMKATAEHDISMAAGILPLRRSNPAWSTSCTWSLRRWLWEAARGACPTVSVKLELLDERRFGNGMAHLHHRTTT